MGTPRNGGNGLRPVVVLTRRQYYSNSHASTVPLDSFSVWGNRHYSAVKGPGAYRQGCQPFTAVAIAPLINRRCE